MVNNNKYLRYLSLTFIILTLNIIWEFLHYQLYIDLSGIPSTVHLLMASGADILIILCVFLMNSYINKSSSWIYNPKAKDYLITIIICLIVAIFIELRALSIGRWAYTSSMPTIFGIGLSPLLQLALTSILGLYLFRRLNKR